MNDEEISILVDELFAKRDGPIEVIPPRPKPHLSCKQCNYYHKSMASTGGQRRAPTYYKSCTHPEAWEGDSQLRGNKRSLIRRFERAEPGGVNVVTPQWCPFLRKKEEEEEDVLSDPTD